MLDLKRSQGTLHDDVVQYFAETAVRLRVHKATDRALSAVEIYKYWQSGDRVWTLGIWEDYGHPIMLSVVQS